MEAYLDNAATTRVKDEVRDMIIKVMQEDYGNPSSKHTKGIKAESYIDDAREVIAGTLKCNAKNITFTSGGTEANNQALIGTAYANERRGKHIITTVIEHASVHEPLAFLESRGFEVTYIPVDAKGLIDMKALSDAVREDTILVSIMYVNNEIGSIQDIAAISALIKKLNKNIIFHVDAIQAYAKLRINPGKLGIDLMSVSGHKFHGPKGTGFLYHRDGIRVIPYIYGGGQESDLRSGTENVPGIAGLGVAAGLAYRNLSDNVSRMKEVKGYLTENVGKIDNVVINPVEHEDTAPHIISVSIEGVKSEVLLHALAADGVYVSSGSACSSNHPGLSGTLKAIGVADSLVDSTIRLSLCSETTMEEAEYAVEMLKKHIPVLRKFKRY